MAKRSYRAQNVNQINVEKLSHTIGEHRVVFGVDIAKDLCYGRLLTEEKQILCTIKWHQCTETRQLLEMLTQLKPHKIEVALEPSGTYGDALRYQLGQAGIPVYRVSGKRCHDAAEVFDGVPSMHDAKAADIVARLHVDGASQPWEYESETQLAFKVTVQETAMYDMIYHQMLNRLEALMARHWPELTSILDLTTATATALLAKFGGPKAIVENEKEARALMKRVGQHLLKDEKIDRVIASAQNTIGAPMIEQERQHIIILAQEAIQSGTKADQCKKEVEQLSDCSETVKNLRGTVGTMTAAVLVAYLGEASEYETPSQYVKAMGLNLKERSSGTHKGKLKITKRGASETRHYMYLATLRKIGPDKDAVVSAWYQKKVERDGARNKLRAVIAVMRKLASALWHVGRGATFDSSKLFDVRKLNLVQEAIASS